MKIIDTLLLIAAGFSLYTLAVVFSTLYFAGINHLIPDIFSGRAIISLTSTFHLVVGSLVTGFLLVRFAQMPVLLALIIAIAINFESYFAINPKKLIRKWFY